MKIICPNCKKEYENGTKFCMECGTKLPQKIVCRGCGAELPPNAKFCMECGTPVASEVSGIAAGGHNGMSVGDSNVISGDIIGKKEESKFYGNTTIVKNEDESKKVNQCSICGKHLLNLEGHTCPVCGRVVCGDHFDIDLNCCTSCSKTAVDTKISRYREKLAQVYEDGVVSHTERQELQVAARQLGIDQETAEKLEEEEKNKHGNTADTLTRVEVLELERAEELFYEEGDRKKALDILTPIYDAHWQNEKVLSLYLAVLADYDPDEASDIINGLTFDMLEAYLTGIRIAIRNKKLDEAERIIKQAENNWPGNSLVLCHKYLYLVALADHFKNDSFKQEAIEAVKDLNPGTATSKVELSWIIRIQNEAAALAGKESLIITKEMCRQYQLYWWLINRYFPQPLPVEMVKVEQDSGESFYIGKYPVTQKEWTSVMGSNPSYFKGENRPVECVTWYDAIEFCNRLSEKNGLMPAYEITGVECGYDEDSDYNHIIEAEVSLNENANGYRLPTDKQSEFAARGGKKSKGFTYAGSDNIDEVAWYDENSGHETHDVGLKKPNELGIYDMTGNVWEWCWDTYFIVHRFFRGGSYDYDVGYCKMDGFCSNSPFAASYNLGFRIVCSSTR